MATSRSNVTRLAVGLLGASIAWTDNIQDRFANEYMIRRIRAEAYCTVAGTLYLKESDAADMSSATTLQTISVSAGVTIELPWTLLTKRYYRLEYANGGTAQTALMSLFMERSGRPLEDVYVPDGNDLALGATTDAAASTGGAGSVSAKLRNLSTNMNATLTAIGLTTTAISDAGGTGAVNGHLRRATDTLGQQDGAAVITDANGRVQQYLRGLVKLLAEGLGKLILRGGAKGATAAADLTSKAVDANTQALHVTVAETANVAVTGSSLTSNPSATQTRPNNATPYTAGDVVGQDPAANMTFTTTLAAASGFVIYSATLEIDVAAIPAGMAGFVLHLYTSAPTAIADNSPYDLPSGDRAKHLDTITFLTPTDLGSTLWGQFDGNRIGGKLADGSQDLYGILKTLGAYTPTASTVKAIKLYIAAV